MVATRERSEGEPRKMSVIGNNAATVTPGRCEARRESLAQYLANREFASSSELRRLARFGPDAVRRPDAGGFTGSAMGEALHALLLEPEVFESQYLVLDGSVPSNKVLSEREAMTREWLDAWQWAALVKARDAIVACTQGPLADWLGRGEKELSIYWTDEAGSKWKARPDCFTEEIVLDLKTTADCRPEAFARTRERLAYDLQAAHYVEAVLRLTGRRPRFAFVAAELEPPYAVFVHELAGGELEAAIERLEDVKRRFTSSVAASTRA